MYYRLDGLNVELIHKLLEKGIPTSTDERVLAAAKIVSQAVRPHGALGDGPFAAAAGVILCEVATVEEFITRYNDFLSNSLEQLPFLS